MPEKRNHAAPLLVDPWLSQLCQSWGGGGNQLLKIVVLSGRVPLCTLGIADYTGSSHLNTVVLNVSEDKSQYQFYLWYAERE